MPGKNPALASQWIATSASRNHKRLPTVMKTLQQMELESRNALQLELQDPGMMYNDWLCATVDCQISLYLTLPRGHFCGFYGLRNF